jgi:hypothetical protein
LISLDILQQNTVCSQGLFDFHVVVERGERMEKRLLLQMLPMWMMLSDFFAFLASAWRVRLQLDCAQAENLVRPRAPTQNHHPADNECAADFTRRRK